MLNTPLLRKTLEHITAYPEEYTQAKWVTHSSSCGTTGCLAYHLATIDSDLYFDFRKSSAAGVEIGYGLVDSGGMSPGSISRVAQERAGLNDHQAGRLFDGANTLYDLWEQACEFSGGEIEPPIELTAPW